MASRKRRARGIPYTLGEVELVLKNHVMDQYHRDLMVWMVKQVKRLRRKK